MLAARLFVDVVLRHIRQDMVGVSLLVQRFLQELAVFIEPQHVRERANAAIPSEFVVLDALRRTDERGVHHFRWNLTATLKYLVPLEQ